MIKKGGMESGLKKAETNAHEAKLFKISGGMRPVMQEVNHGRSSLGQIMLEMSERFCPKCSKRYHGFLTGGHGLVLDEPRRRVRPRLGQENIFFFFSRKIFFDFIFTFLSSGKKIFVWKGSGASGQEKMTAGLIAAKWLFFNPCRYPHQKSISLSPPLWRILCDWQFAHHDLAGWRTTLVRSWCT